MQLIMSSDSDFPVQNEYAVRCSIVSKPVNVLEYIKSVSSLVGASHILAVFEETDSIKVFFDDKRHVDTILKSCLHVMGRHVRVDYVVPPGSKLILSNVDPIITNFDIMRLLTVYGTVVSPIIRPPISDDVELCHISYGVRYVYMLLNGCIPERLEFKYGDQFSYFKVSVLENCESHMIQYIKSDNFEESPDEEETTSTARNVSLPGPSGGDTFAIEEAVDPVLVSVQSVSGINHRESVESPNNQTSDFKEDSIKPSPLESIGEVVKRKRGRPPVPKRKTLTATLRAAKIIRRNVKRKWRRGPYKKSKCKRQYLRKAKYFQTSFPSTSMLPDLVTDNECNSSVNEEVLDNEKLLSYLESVKHHRAPLELAKQYIGDDCDSHKISKFIVQLRNYRKSLEDTTLKTRMWRVIKNITDAVQNEAKMIF